MAIEDTWPLQSGIDVANAEHEGTNAQARAQECADVKRWSDAIKAAREFDGPALKQYARNRSYARADRTHHLVRVPIAQSYIDVIRSFIYARDPDVDVSPSPLTEAPPQKAVMAMVAQQMQQPGGVGAAPQLTGAIARLLGTTGGQGASPALPGGPVPLEDGGDMQDAAIKQAAAQMLEPYQRGRENAEQFASTLELVITALWRKAKLKAQLKETVGSAATIGPGWIKAVWLQRMGRDPEIETQLNDIQDNLARMAELHRELNAGEAPNDDVARAELESIAAGLEAKVEVVIARGFAVDFIAGEDIQVSTDVRSLASYVEASWIAHRSFLTVEDAKSEHPDIADKLGKAKSYYPVKPVDQNKARDSGAMADSVSAKDADAFTDGDASSGSSYSSMTGGTQFVCKWEVWDRTTSTFLQFFDGMDCYARAPSAPYPATSRFYPFFGYFIGHVNGERHPRSLITRSESLFDEYNSIRTNYRKHRQRAIPKCGFDATNYSGDEIAKLEGASTGEMVGLKPARPGEPIDKSIVPIQYNQVDMGLYDTSQIRAELEMIWGIQEALSSSIHTSKTATEAEIQQHGTESRSGYMRDDLEEMMSEMATYTAEVALQTLSQEDVQEIAGPFAIWPEQMTVEDLGSLVKVSIHAGSTGKPNTAARRQAWAAVLPPLQAAIEQVAKLRNSSPDDVADCIEAVVEETIAVTGERIDATRFLPESPRNPPPPAPPPQPPLRETALDGTQIQALTGVLADVRGGVITPESAIALIRAVAPKVPTSDVQAMVSGSVPRPGDPVAQFDAPHASTPPPPALPVMPPQGVTA